MSRDNKKDINDFENKMVHLVCQELFETVDMLDQFDGGNAQALRNDLLVVISKYSV